MSHALPRYRRHEEREKDIARIAAVIEGGSAVPSARGTRLVGHRSAEGDPFRLRGVPFYCTSVGGTQPGTDPLAAVLAAEREGRLWR